jgi:glucose-1-phosphate cytidylyltransferase
MKVVLLAGGLGTRLTEETEIRPKPMVEIGGRPILWHIMKHYAHYGFQEFLVALGYKGEYIKRYFMDYYTLNGSMTLDLATGAVQPQIKECENWKLHLLDTGVQTNTGGRLKRLESYLGDETFMITYGDGVSNIDLQKLLEFHKSHGKWVTVSAVRPPARFGGLVIEGDLVANFTEKPQAGEGWINGGFLVMEPQVFKYLTNDSAGLEVELLERLAIDGQLAAYRHYDFWQCMDTLRDKYNLENYWQSGNPPWQVWEH